MENNLVNQVALVTGGGTGIGRGICIDLAKKGAKVIVTGRRMSMLQETQSIIRKSGGYAECLELDVSNKENVNQVVDKIYDKYGRIDILVSNAGNLSAPAFIYNMKDEDWDSVLKTHLYGTFYCAKAVSKKMKQNKYGRIVLISSVAAIHGFNGAINYAASKAALEGMTMTLAKELGVDGITVNCIQPGIIHTPMADGFVSAKGETFIKDTPVKRIGEPKDVACAVSFYCSPDAGFITGTILKVDGGYMLQSSMDQLVNSACNSEIEE